MRGRIGRGTGLVALALLLALVAILQVRVDRHAPPPPALDHGLYVPSRPYLKQTALGYEQAWADVLWLRTIAYYADQVTQEGKLTYLYHMLDVITTLDPRFLYPYLFGGVTLSIDLDRPDLANKILRKAMNEYPNVWKVPFLIGFNAYFGEGDAATAARYIDYASRLPGAPAYLKGFASRLYVKGNGRERALQFLREIIRQTEDPALRAQLVKRYREIEAGLVTGPFERSS
jgi:hypothetical protein